MFLMGLSSDLYSSGGTVVTKIISHGEIRPWSGVEWQFHWHVRVHWQLHWHQVSHNLH